MNIRYITKSGEVLLHSTDSTDLDKWVLDRLAHENGLFPHRDGYISADAILRIDRVSAFPKRHAGREAAQWIHDEMPVKEER